MKFGLRIREACFFFFYISKMKSAVARLKKEPDILGNKLIFLFLSSVRWDWYNRHGCVVYKAAARSRLSKHNICHKVSKIDDAPGAWFLGSLQKIERLVQFHLKAVTNPLLNTQRSKYGRKKKNRSADVNMTSKQNLYALHLLLLLLPARLHLKLLLDADDTTLIYTDGDGADSCRLHDGHLG